MLVCDMKRVLQSKIVSHYASACFLKNRINYRFTVSKTAFKVIVLSTLFFAVVIFSVLFVDDVALASDNPTSLEELEKQLEEGVFSAIDDLDLKDFEQFVNSLSAEQKEAISFDDVKKLLKQLSEGENKSFFESFFKVIGNSIASYFLGCLPSVVSILVICILKSMLISLTSSFNKTSTIEVVGACCNSAIIIVLISGVANVVETVSKTIQGLSNFASATFPVILTLTSMLGGGVSIATYSPYMSVLCSFILQLITAVVLPAFVATIVFCVVGNISKSVKLDKLTKLVKSSSSWLVGIVFGLFATFLTVQGISGGIVDKFGFNVAKFALSSYVPILGGYLSDGFDLLSTSLVLTKNAFGYTSVIVLVAIVLFPLVKVVVFSLTMRLASAVAEPIGDKSSASLLSSVAGGMNLLISALAGVGFMFFLLIMMMIASCNMGI